MFTSDDWVINDETNADVATDDYPKMVGSARFTPEAATCREQATGIDDTVYMHQCGHARISFMPGKGIVSQADSGIVQFDPDIKWL